MNSKWSRLVVIFVVAVVAFVAITPALAAEPVKPDWQTRVDKISALMDEEVVLLVFSSALEKKDVYRPLGFRTMNSESSLVFFDLVDICKVDETKIFGWEQQFMGKFVPDDRFLNIPSVATCPSDGSLVANYITSMVVYTGSVRVF